MVAEQHGLAEQAERHDEMAEYIERMGEQPVELSVEEPNLLSFARKNAVGSRCGAWRIIAEQKENSEGNEQPAKYSTEDVVKVGTELPGVRDGILVFKDMNLIPSASTCESKVLYYKVKGDDYRHIDEFATGDAESKAAEHARVACAEDTKTARKDLVVTHPIRLGLVLNFCVFLHEVIQNPDEAWHVSRSRMLPWSWTARLKTPLSSCRLVRRLHSHHAYCHEVWCVGWRRPFRGSECSDHGLDHTVARGEFVGNQLQVLL